MDTDTHYFVLLWSKKYPLKYLWSGSDLCKWEGISCDTVKQQVTMLFPKLGLTGTIPTWNPKKKDFNPANVNVISINLAMNALTGTFPEHFGQLRKLQELYLLGTSLQGTIPQSWNNLPNLAIVDVSNTKACGNLPAWDKTSMPSLQYMHFNGNTLMHGTVPESLATFGMVSFNTSGCPLCGCMPAAFSNSLYMRVQLSNDQPQLVAPTCATANVCTAEDLTCKARPQPKPKPNAASAPVLALGSLAAVVLSVAAALVL
ncbi:surface antigen-like protein [Leptomonas pyrrhocoris]|nr:surface antigen-like protein [Leptomonas pyrrhocoris]KPA73354.1 surface antigen-like protein [Leptomonas pyrrhocoris]|eukprot:XP_015651793.1 surface antigen-like protein [Leptomonas pyrrhocoris]